MTPTERPRVLGEIGCAGEVEREGKGNRDPTGAGRPPQPRRLAFTASDEEEGDAENRQDDDAGDGAFGIHAGEDPDRLVDRRSHETENGEQRPPTDPGEPQQAQVQQQDVAEQGRRAVHVRGNEQWRRKPTEEAEDRDELGLAADRQGHTHHRDEHHEHECGQGPDEAVEILRGPCRSVENHNAGAGQGIGRRRLITLHEPLRPDEAGEAGDDAENNPHGRRDQSVLDGVLEKEQRREGKHNPAGRSRPADTDPALPVDALPRRLRPGGGWWLEDGRLGGC